MAKILSVEDDSDLQYLYSMMLARRGHTLDAAKSTADAIVMLARGGYDLIILDMNMPDVPGTRVIEFVRQNAQLRHMPILVISANDYYRRQAMTLGVSAYLLKPVTLRDLDALVHDALTGDQA